MFERGDHAAIELKRDHFTDQGLDARERAQGKPDMGRLATLSIQGDVAFELARIQKPTRANEQRRLLRPAKRTARQAKCEPREGRVAAASLRARSGRAIGRQTVERP